MTTFLLLFLSSCTLGAYDCVHEILTYDTYEECRIAQGEAEGFKTVCAAVVQGEYQEFNVKQLGTKI